MFIFFQSGCIRVKWLYSCKSCCTRAKVVVLGQKLFYSCNVAVFRQNGRIRAKEVIFLQSGCFQAKVVLF